MKNKIFPLMTVLLCGLTLWISNSQAATRVRIGIGLGHGGHGYYPHRPHWHVHPCYYAQTLVYATPNVMYTPATSTTTTQVTTNSTSVSATRPSAQPQTTPVSAPPFGIPENDHHVKSPFSNFTINDAGMKSGTVVYDTFTRQPFRIP
jgi:hypothetical protein